MLSLVTIPLRDTVSLACNSLVHRHIPGTPHIGIKVSRPPLSSLVQLNSWLDANRPDLQYSPAPHKSLLPSLRRPQLILQDVCCTHETLQTSRHLLVVHHTSI